MTGTVIGIAYTGSAGIGSGSFISRLIKTIIYNIAEINHQRYFTPCFLIVAIVVFFIAIDEIFRQATDLVEESDSTL